MDPFRTGIPLMGSAFAESRSLRVRLRADEVVRLGHSFRGGDHAKAGKPCAPTNSTFRMIASGGSNKRTPATQPQGRHRWSGAPLDGRRPLHCLTDWGGRRRMNAPVCVDRFSTHKNWGKTMRGFVAAIFGLMARRAREARTNTAS
jgi:hypothetical protein